MFFVFFIWWGISPTPHELIIPPEPAEQRAEMVSHNHGLFEGPRSGKWPAVRNKFIQENPRCAACGSLKNLNVHHLSSFHDHPELELDPNNLITLCRTHHFLMGHSGRWADTNERCLEAVQNYRKLHPWK